jgi:glycine oxidase
MRSPRPAEVVVVGGGAIGLSIAWRAALAGSQVTLIDAEPERRATLAAAGMLAPVTEVHYGEEELLQLNLLSAAIYPEFIAELEDLTGMDTGYRRSGTMLVARDGDENAALDELFAFQLRLGLEVKRLRASECRAEEPALARTVRGGILVEGDHQIDNRALAGALAEACRSSGVDLVRAEVRSVESEGDRVSGVRLADGSSIPSGQVVLAAGAWISAIEGLPDDVVPPVRPVKGQLLHLRGTVPPVRRNIRGLDVYLVARPDGRVVVGATVEEQGLDSRVTAEAVYTLLRDAYELVPGIVDLEFVETVVGFRPGTPDNAPIIGGTAIEGLIFATGHYRNGILLTPITGRAVAELVTTRKTPTEIEPFAPARFKKAVS